MIKCLESANTALQGYFIMIKWSRLYKKDAIMVKLKRDGFLREWDVVFNTMWYGVDNFIL